MIRLAFLAAIVLAGSADASQDGEALRLLRSKDWTTARAALVSQPGLANEVLKALDGPDVDVRQRAAVVLGALDSLPAQKKLIEAVAKDQPLVARKALFALLHLARPTRHGKHGEPWGNRIDLQEIANLGKRAVPYLIEAVRQVDDPDYTLPFTCEILGMIGDRRAIPALIAVVDRDKGFGFSFAAEALGKFNDPSLLPVFARNVHKELPDYGTITDAYLLENGESGRQVAENALATNKDPEVRRSLTWVLARFEDYRSAPALRHALNDPDKDVRASAQYALQKIYAARKKRPHTPSTFAYNSDYGRRSSTKHRTR